MSYSSEVQAPACRRTRALIADLERCYRRSKNSSVGRTAGKPDGPLDFFVRNGEAAVDIAHYEKGESDEAEPLPQGLLLAVHFSSWCT